MCLQRTGNMREYCKMYPLIPGSTVVLILAHNIITSLKTQNPRTMFAFCSQPFGKSCTISKLVLLQSYQDEYKVETVA